VVERAVPFSVVDSGVPTGARAAAGTVGEALRAVGIATHGADLVHPAPETPLAPGLRVSIVRAQPVTIVAKDLLLEARSRAPTVGQLLAEQNVALGPLDRVEPAAEASLPAGGTVRVVRVREEEHREHQVLPFQTRVQRDDQVAPGRRVRLQDGVTGLVERLIKIVIEDEVEVDRQVLGETPVRQRVDEVVLVGPGVVPASSRLPAAAPAPAQESAEGTVPDDLAGRRVLMMEATAYDPGPESTGKRPGHPAYGITASGMRAGYGIVAVDPRVIPFHTRLYIPGYGYAVAGDTGSAIKGHRIDLGYATYGEAVRWGRRMVPVYILE
jgi:3D (Asp-Asp-Asp) domain-containing protein